MKCIDKPHISSIFERILRCFSKQETQQILRHSFSTYASPMVTQRNAPNTSVLKVLNDFVARIRRFQISEPVQADFRVGWQPNQGPRVACMKHWKFSHKLEIYQNLSTSFCLSFCCFVFQKHTSIVIHLFFS